MTRFFGINEEDSSSRDTTHGLTGSNEAQRESPRLTESRRMTGQPPRGAMTRMSSQVVATQLPNLDRQQHSNVFLLAMMEQNCQLKALHMLNKNRAPEDQLSQDDEEVKALADQLYANFANQVGGSDDLPENLVGAEGSEVRSLYTAHFDHILEKAAEQALRGVTSSPSSASIADLRNASIAAVDIPSAVPRDMGHSLLMASSPTSNDLFGSTPKGLFGPSTSSYVSSKSVYATEYEEIALLGRGGYGSVYKARNHLDGQMYAIKKILITSQRLQRSRESDQIEALLAELRTLAKLQHTNIVRYYHGWIETSYNTAATRRPKLLADLTSDSMMTRSEITDSIRFQDIDQAVDDMSNDNDDYSLNQPVPVNDDTDDGIIFGFSSSSHNHNSRNDRARRSSHATATSSTTQKMSMLSIGEDEDPDVETIPRNFTSHDSPVSQRHTTSPLSPKHLQKTQQYLGPDITLCIKMSLHPTTLLTYLSPDPPKETDLPLRHCFHQSMAIEILLSILDGVDYLHSQKIIHRDLKPANIFLSVHYQTQPSVHGCVNINACPECQSSTTTENHQPLWITPCIGDFGLIAEVKEDSFISPSTTETYKPSALSQIQPKPVGTQYYRPSTMPTKEPVICQRLDVYALGVIALELVYRFATRSERLKVLDGLSRGVFPEELVRHDMADGILSMVCADRDRRWGCGEVREWLLGLRK